MPEIKRVISVIFTPRIVETTTFSKGKVVINGCINVFLEYAGISDCNSQTAQYCTFTIPYTYFLDRRYAKTRHKKKISITIEYQESHIIHGRALNVFIIASAQKISGCTENGIDITRYSACVRDHIHTRTDA